MAEELKQKQKKERGREKPNSADLNHTQGLAKHTKSGKTPFECMQ